MGEKPVKNDAGQLSLDEEAKKEAWREHYERLLNVEFPWNPEDLSEESPVEGPSQPITLEMITKAISKMASGKAAGPSGIVAEMLKPVGEAGAVEVRDLIEDIISEGCIPTDWQESFIVNLYKGKGDASVVVLLLWRCFCCVSLLFLLSVFILWFICCVGGVFCGFWVAGWPPVWGGGCSFCLPRVPFVNCRQFMYLVISLLVLRAGYGI